MTEPTPPPVSLDPTNSVIFCIRCQIHYAMTHQPLCPVCLPTAAEEAKG